MGACGTNCGITRERERQKDAARALVARLCVETAEGEGQGEPEVAFEEAEVRSITRSLGEVLPCRSCVVEGERASWIYLSATLGPASWIELREGRTGVLPESIEDVGLRVGLSARGRYATLQEVRVTGAREPSGHWIEESRMQGVEDRRLQLFVKATQGLLRKLKVVTLDAAFLMEASPVTSRPEAMSALGEADTTLWSVLFDADPAVTSVGRMLFDEERSAFG